MNFVELHRVNSRAWYSVGAVVRPEDELRFVRERVAVGDETAQMMGGSVDRHLQLWGRWLAVYRGKLPGLPLSRAARLRLWRGPAMQANHERFVEVVAAHFDGDLSNDFDLGVRDERYGNFLSAWFLALRRTIREWAWMKVPGRDVRRYLCGASAREAKRTIRREYVARGAAAEDFSAGLEILLRRAREEGGDTLGLPARRYREVLAALRRRPDRIRTQDDLYHAIEAARSTRRLRIRTGPRKPSAA